MLIKSADDRAEALAQLERAASALSGNAARQAEREIRQRQAGSKGEAESAYHIDFGFKKTGNWAVIHDLRLEHGDRAAQIDHLLLNRFMECFVLESKHFHAGLKITEDGEFLRWNKYERTYEGMPSPLEQNERHIAVLRDVMKEIELPTRAGLTLAPTFLSFVLVSPQSRIDRPREFDSSRVIKADQLKQRIMKEMDDASAFTMITGLAKVVSSETMRGVAEQLVARHRPVEWPMPTWATQPGTGEKRPELSQSKPANTEASGPVCKNCGSQAGAILYGKYGYYFKCAGCKTNTAIRFTCDTGHQPRLRKAGDNFYRDCPECKSSRLYFSNA